MGGRVGNPQDAGDPSDTEPGNPHPQIEVGSSQDMFVVYRGKQDRPLNSSPVWRYTAANALRSPGVPAVEEFHKLIAESEKQQAAKP